MIGTGLLVIVNRNPVASALCLVASFVFMAGLFVLLNAFFLAVIQILVYAGAVMVLFLFIIMLLDLKATADRRPNLFSYLFGGVVAVALMALFVQVLGYLPAGEMNAANLPAADGAYDARSLGELLFTKHLLPFLATGVLLLAATAGVVLLSKRGLGSDSTPPETSNPPAAP
ncbi:MAG: NADH-quinone oxidoreductase subunit J [Verrucomicrobiota bacterium]